MTKALRILLFAAGLAVLSAAEPPARPGVGEVIVVFKTHFDITYTALVKQVVSRYRVGMADNALSLIKAGSGLPPEHWFGVKIRFGRLSDFADAIAKERPALPVVRADMPDTWIHGIMSFPVETKIARNARPQIGAAELLHTLLRLWGVGVRAPAAQIAGAYEQSLFYGEHTWGHRIHPFGQRYGEEWRDTRAAGHYELLERSWNDQRAYARNAAATASALLTEGVANLAQSVGVNGPRIVVYNPLPWRRDAVVTGFLGDVAALRDAASGQIVPVAREGRRIQFVGRGLPAAGYRTYTPLRQAQPTGGLLAQGDVIENEFLKVVLDPARGGKANLPPSSERPYSVAAGSRFRSACRTRCTASEPGFDYRPGRGNRRSVQPRSILPQYGSRYHGTGTRGCHCLSAGFPPGESWGAGSLPVHTHVQGRLADRLRQPLQ